MVAASAAHGGDKLIGFDMGGTSTDVSHYAGRFELVDESVVAGVRIRAPMMQIHTVAAGGGSVCRFDGLRFRVGPESAGAQPGPACYRGGGPLTVTDCNVFLGRIVPERFPAVFGANGDQSLDPEESRARLEEVAAALCNRLTPAKIAEGFLETRSTTGPAIRKILDRARPCADARSACSASPGVNTLPVATRWHGANPDPPARRRPSAYGSALPT